MPLELPGYTEVRELGAGASGRVVVARYDATGQLVAVKVLSDLLLGDSAFRERFRREAETLAQVRHPNVVSLYGYYETPDQAVILMELIDGVTLERVVERGPVVPEAGLAVLSGALLGLDAAHAAGVVHRDLKPANILVEGHGGSHLVDFGVAVRSGQQDVPAGTPIYMAPEQWRGAASTPQTDVYAATGVYYRCITGRWPFSGHTVEELRHQHLNIQPDVGMLPPPIAQLVLRGMAKNPVQRPATAGMFHTELEQAAEAVHGRDWRGRGVLALGGVAGLFAAAFPLAVVSAAHGAAGAATAAAAGASAVAPASASGVGGAGAAAMGGGSVGSAGAGAGAGAAGAGGAGAGAGSGGMAAGGAGVGGAGAAGAGPGAGGAAFTAAAKGASAGSTAVRVGLHSVLLKGSVAAVVLAGATVGGLAATHRGPFSTAKPASASAGAATSTATQSSSSSSSASSASTGTGSTDTSSSSASSALSGSLGFSHNTLFPAAAGDTWTYRTAGTSGTTTSTQTVVSATPVDGGQQVVLRESSSTGLATTATYIFYDDGRISATQVTTGNLSVTSKGLTFVIPSKDDIVAGKSHTSTGTLVVGSVSETVTTTSIGDGTEDVTVPAGTFTAYRLKITIAVSTNQSAAAALPAITETVDLAENVGVVRIVSDFGNADLVSSNLVG